MSDPTEACWRGGASGGLKVERSDGRGAETASPVLSAPDRRRRLLLVLGLELSESEVVRLASVRVRFREELADGRSGVGRDCSGGGESVRSIGSLGGLLACCDWLAPIVGAPVSLSAVSISSKSSVAGDPKSKRELCSSSDGISAKRLSASPKVISSGRVCELANRAMFGAAGGSVSSSSTIARSGLGE